MRKTIGAISLGIGVWGCLTLNSGVALGQKKPAAAPATEADYLQLRNTKQAIGTVVSFDTVGGVMTVKLSLSRYAPNPKYKPPTPARANNTQASSQLRSMQQMQQQQRQHQLNIQRQQVQLARARSPQQRQQIMRQIAQANARFQQQQAQSYARMQAAAISAARTAATKKVPVNSNNNPYLVVTSVKIFDLKVDPKAVVRKMFLPTAFDDTGNFKIYTEEEKIALRGKDASKPGYRAIPEDIATGQEVRLYLTPPGANPPAPDDDPDFRNRPNVNMIVMTREMAS